MLRVVPPLPLARGSFPRLGSPPQPATWHCDSSFSAELRKPPDSSAKAEITIRAPLENSVEVSQNLRDAPVIRDQNSALISGLPDDVALLCLARTGRSSWPACRFETSVPHIRVINTVILPSSTTFTFTKEEI